MNYNIKEVTVAFALSMTILNTKYIPSFNMTNRIHINTNQIKMESIAKQNSPINQSQIQEKERQKTVNQKNLQQTSLNKTLAEEAKEKENKDINSKKESSTNEEISSNKETNEETITSGGSIDKELFITLTFYTSLPEENGGYNNLNCRGRRLIPGTVANNVLPLGTQIYTKQFGTLTVSDKGGSDFDSIHRLDVYVPIDKGESIGHYKERVQNMGKVKIKGYIIS